MLTYDRFGTPRVLRSSAIGTSIPARDAAEEIVRRIGLPGSGISSADCGDGGGWDGWPSLRIALTCGALRNTSSKSEHEPTSGRSKDYGSGHPIRVFPDIGRTFSWLPTSPINVRRRSCFRLPVGRLRSGQAFKPIGEMWFHRSRKMVSILFRPSLSGTPREPRGSSEAGFAGTHAPVIAA